MGLQGIAETDAPKVEQIILDTLQHVADTGILEEIDKEREREKRERRERREDSDLSVSIGGLVASQAPSMPAPSSSMGLLARLHQRGQGSQCLTPGMSRARAMP